VKIKIEKKDVDKFRIWFTEYVHTFKTEDAELLQNTDLKERHTKRVVKEIIKIGEQLGLTEEELNMAETVALFHDIGRFEQYARHRTFSDNNSIDHADLGIQILEQNHIFDCTDQFTKELIICTIRSHNKPCLPVNESGECLFYTKLLRDADKLDIWRMVTGYYNKRNAKRNDALILDLPDTPGFSEEVYNDLLNKSIVNLKHVRNLNDLKLLQLGWIFDINFKPTAELIRKHRFLEKIRDVLPESKEISEIFEHITSYRNEMYENEIH
jgi:putative nucleotidyltransferase with HDIG domain